MELTASPPDLSTLKPDLSTFKDLPETLKDLPDMTRDAIERGLGEVRLPERETLERAGRAVSDLDISKAIAGAATGAATAVGLIRPAPRRWPFVLVAAAAFAALAWVVADRGALGTRVDGAVRRLKAWSSPGDGTPAEAVAFTAAETAPIEPSMTSNGTGSDYPDGLGDGEALAPEPALEATW